ncbi:hypothetical protein SF23_17285 [Streptomyces sp. MBRL 10]|nr:hypothetical protein SF23_17285 [Streptomyces sp. MBRL 10]
MRDYNLARAVTVALSVLFGLLFLLALAFGLWGGKSSPLTEADVIGTWHGDRGSRLDVLADGRARLSDVSGWKCSPDEKPGVFTGEGGWTLGHLPTRARGSCSGSAPGGPPRCRNAPTGSC